MVSQTILTVAAIAAANDSDPDRSRIGLFEAGTDQNAVRMAQIA
jgi:hypothetical protein